MSVASSMIVEKNVVLTRNTIFAIFSLIICVVFVLLALIPTAESTQTDFIK